jgi:RHS repeat-associated protein
MSFDFANRGIASAILFSFICAQAPLFGQDRPGVVGVEPDIACKGDDASLPDFGASAAGEIPAEKKSGEAVFAIVAPEGEASGDRADESSAADSDAASEAVPAGWYRITLGEVELLVPPGAVRSPTPIGIRKLSAVRSLGEGMANATAGAAGYRFEPKGMVFERAVRLTMRFDKSLLDSEAALSNLFTYFYDERNGRWERLSRIGIDRSRATITSLALHFTDMINATLALPEGGEPIRYDATSIKNIAAADPDSLVPSPEGLGAGPFGSASWQLPLRLPPGRKGMVPELALRYSSDLANGWLGKGFDIELPAITIDTRFGMPRYEAADRYIFEGEELLYSGRDSDGSYLYVTRVQKNFRRIRWYRAGEAAADDYWQVTDKSGMLREYGHGRGGEASGAWIGPNRNDRRKTFAWYLSKVRDTFGNTIRYDYSYDPDDAYCYLSAIRYTGYESAAGVEDGPFTVSFKLEARDDRRIDARSGFASTLAKRLAGIEIRRDGKVLRSYEFAYRDPEKEELGISQLASFAEMASDGTLFYRYGFDYHGLPERKNAAGEVAGYDAFGETEKTWSLGSAFSPFEGLYADKSASLGASFTVGLSLWIWIPFFGTRTIASFSINAGAGNASSAALGKLIDVNGDGLPDLAWRSGGNLMVRPNTGSGFDAASPLVFPGLGAAFDKESQSSFWFGAQASVGPLSGAVTWQESSSQAQSAFADVNGDGFVDFVAAGVPSFGLNDGSSFGSVPWQFGESAIEGARGEGANSSDTYERAYYVQTPFRAWEAGRSGQLVVEQSARLLDASRVGQVLVATVAQGEAASTSSLSSAQPVISRSTDRSISRGDRLFFYLDCAGNELKAGSEWNIKMRYTGIRLFEPFQDAATFDPPATLAAPPAGLDAIYTRSGGAYALKSEWRSVADAEASGAIYDRLVASGFFVARNIPRILFEKLLDCAAAGESSGTAFSYYDVPSRSLVTAGPAGESATKRDVLLAGYVYDLQGDLFRRSPWQADADPNHRQNADDAFKATIGALDYEEKKEIAYCRPYDASSPLRPRVSGSGFAYSPAAQRLVVDPVIARSASAAADGMEVLDRGLLLETRRDDVGRAIERLWLAKAGDGYRLNRENILEGGESDPIEAGLDVVGFDPLVVSFSDRGVSRAIKLSGSTSLIASLPGELYEGVLTDSLVGGTVFSPDSYAALPEGSWNAITQALAGDAATQAAFSRAYHAERVGYVLDPGLDDADLHVILNALHERSAVAGSVFGTLPGDPDAALRVILFDESSFADFIRAEGGELIDCFASFPSGEGRRYYPTPNAISTRGAELAEAVKRYRRDAELLLASYARENDGAWHLVAALSHGQKDAVTRALGACGLRAYTSLERSLVYRSDQLLPVTETTLPAGSNCEAFAPRADPATAAEEPGAKVGSILLTTFDQATGSVLLHPIYLREYDSARDYSPVDLAARVNMVAKGWRPSAAQGMCGGVEGWYYGLWSAYYDFDPAKIGSIPAVDDSRQSPPPYSQSLTENRGRGDGAGRLITTSGRDITEGGFESPVDVSATALVGTVSSYSDTVMDDELEVASREFSFAAFVSGDTLHPARNGGDTYHRLPQNRSTASAPGALGFIRASHSSATDLNGSVGLPGLGANFSRNTGVSWQYCAYMDMNGDLYPDLVSFRDAQGGASQFSLVPGTGSGFGEAETWRLEADGCLGKTATLAYGFGATVGSGGGALDIHYASSGRPTGVAVAAPDPGYGGGAIGLSGGVNGSFAFSSRTEAFYDMNGDGLIDHVVRTSNGGYLVELNLGNGRFAPRRDWGGGVSTAAFPLFGIGVQGIADTATGGFGVVGGLSFDALFASVSVSGGYNGTVGRTVSALCDMNGDGLPDVVVKEKGSDHFLVRFNLGDHFADKIEKLYRPEWENLDSYRADIASDLEALKNDLGGAAILGSSVRVPASSGGIGEAARGNAFAAEMDPLRIDDDLEYRTGASFNLGASGALHYRWPLVSLDIGLGLFGSSASISADLAFTDIDGDGLPDHALRLSGENSVRVKLNAMGKVGLLKSIRLPQGGRIELDYERAGNTVKMPQSRWVLSHIVRDDGMGGDVADRGEHRYAERYGYAEGFYDRKERTFCGFAVVTATKADGSSLRMTYQNGSSGSGGYYTRGMSTGSELWGSDANGESELMRKTVVTIVEESRRPALRGGASGIPVSVRFPKVASHSERRYESRGGPYVETSVLYEYDEYGNVTDYVDRGTEGSSAQEMRAAIEYDHGFAATGYIMQCPSKISVTGADGRLLRLRTGRYGDRGELLSLGLYESRTSAHFYEMSYDDYGNLASLTDPRGHRREWSYDEEMHAYSVSIVDTGSDGLSLASAMSWDCATGEKLSETDPNGQSMRYGYDVFGRLSFVRSPYDTLSLPAVAYRYDTALLPWSVVTANKVLHDPADGRTIQTVVLVDGLGRALQSAKTGECLDADGRRKVGWNLSGAVAYDAKGRAVLEGQPQFAEGLDPPPLAAMKRPTASVYDALDRVILRKLPDGAAFGASYAVNAGGTAIIEKSIDPLGNASSSERDARGNIVAVKRLDAAGKVLMSSSYRYDELGEMLAAIDGEGHAVEVVYDLLGRRTALSSPDGGTVFTRYDGAGNIAASSTSASRAKGEEIAYEYDGLNRLQKVDYPESEDVSYSYGSNGAPANGIGRLLERRDGSGRMSYLYGKLGEIVATTRTIKRLTPLAESVTASIGYASDYLGRLQSIVYPDGEVLDYGYDSGGQVKTVTGTHWGKSLRYVKDIAYDEYGQRSYIEYGNGTRTSYGYDPDRRWLESLVTKGEYGAVLQNMAYRFDPVGNVLGYTNVCESYGTSQSYAYDELYRLTEATGSSSHHPYGYNDYTSTYEQSFAYDSIGNMTKQQSRVSTSPSRTLGDELSYELGYSYCPGAAHRAEIIGGLYYRYDPNGNIIEERQGGHGSEGALAGGVRINGALRVADTGFGIPLSGGKNDEAGVYSRRYLWDEENRLLRSVEGNLTVDYRYGAEGQRAVKYSSRGESLYFDPLWQTQTDYPSLRQSKHIYVGSARIATQMNIAAQDDLGYETVNTYYYHPDHLGSSQLVTDYQGKEYQRVEYTPFGESWIDKRSDGAENLPYKFTGKERDTETGLYYYGARYYNPSSSTWLSPDPALGDYIPVAPVDESALRHNDNLPGLGGVFNPVNLAVYHYAGNNPVRYTDPDGRDVGMAAWQHDEGRIDVASKKVLATLHPAIQQQARGFVLSAKNAGIDLRVTSGIRSMQEQASLYGKGRDAKGNVVDKNAIVTNAKPGQSYHNFGLAFDVAIVDGKKNNWNTSSTEWGKIGKLGETAGFEWGGRWTDLPDAAHFQDSFGLSTKELTNLYDTGRGNGDYVKLPIAKTQE